ncbi:hypothetical protein ACFL1A_03350, partial [Patescibacteria group bacterium]
MGLVAILATLGLIPFLKKGGSLRTLGAIWTIIPIAIYFSKIPQILQFPYFRLHQPPAYIFIASMAVEPLLLPDRIIEKVFKKKTFHALFIFLITAYTLFQLPMINYEISARTNNHVLPSWLNHLDIQVLDGLEFMKTQKKDKNVLAFNNLEFLAPIISGHTVYTAHKSLSMDYATKIAIE